PASRPTGGACRRPRRWPSSTVAGTSSPPTSSRPASAAIGTTCAPPCRSAAGSAPSARQRCALETDLLDGGVGVVGEAGEAPVFDVVELDVPLGRVPRRRRDVAPVHGVEGVLVGAAAVADHDPIISLPGLRRQPPARIHPYGEAGARPPRRSAR